MEDEPYVPERRPIATRNYSLSIRAATWLANTGVTPNTISVLGMIAGVLAGAVLPLTTREDYGWLLFIAAAVLMQLRLLANMLDGMVAVQTKTASPLGELYNEVPDRVSDTAIFVGAGYAAGAVPTLGYLAALAALFTAYVRAEGKVASGRQAFCGPMGKPQRMALMTLACLYAGLAPAAWQPQIAGWPEWGVMAFALLLVAVGAAITSLRRLWRTARELRKESV